jgi:hypothetical protein
VTHNVLIAHAEGEESIAEQLATPLRKAGYEVSHAGSVLIGESVVEEASRLLSGGAAVVLCGTVKAIGTGWAHRLVNAARQFPGVRVFPIQFEKDAYVQQLAFDGKIGRYWHDPAGTVAELISSLRKHFPSETDDACDGTEAQSQFEDFLRRQVEFYEAREWTHRAVPLRIAKHQGAECYAHDAILKWLSETTSRVLILCGDFGSGKTWLARRICRDLAANTLAGQVESPLPIFIPLSKLHLQTVQTFPELLSLASPVPLLGRAFERRSTRLFFVLDGLDELLVLSGNTVESAKRVFAIVSSLLPQSARVMITCRIQVLDSIRNWIDLLFEDLRSSGSGFEDRTDVAIDRALGRGNPIATTFEICDVLSEQADLYLKSSPASELWGKVSSQRAYRDLARVPFTLFLLEEALPSLMLRAEVPDLPALYRAAVLTWLYRDRMAASIGIEPLLTRLEEIAEATFIAFARVNPQYDELLVNAGLLHQRSGIDSPTFRHFSIFEYFIARVLERQLRAYSAALLCRLNLVYMYNVNRFLVPLLLGNQARSAAARLGSIDDVLSPGGQVSSDGFFRFIEETHWREREGFGTWTIKMAKDGTAPFEGEDLDLQSSLGLCSRAWSALPVPVRGNAQRPATGISWYDAFECCRWAGARLPTAEELASVTTPDSRGARYEWSSTWFNERCSRISVVCTSGKSRGSRQGLNPDMRSSLIGFRIVPLH